MKKTPLALALLGALSVPAFAQSSVTLFGIVDLSVNQTRNAGTTTTTMQGSQLNSSRLGFKGLEDLGGGLKAGFHLEAGVNPDDGTTNSPQFFNRRSTVMLMGNFGELRLGRDYLPTFWNMAFFDAYGANGYGQLENLTSALGTAVDKFRVNNEIEYLLPGNLGGLYGSAAVSAGEGVSVNKYAGGRLGYASGPFDVAVAYGMHWATPTDKLKTFNVGGSWNFTVLKLLGLFQQYKLGDAKQDAYELSVSVPIGASEVRAGYAHSRTSGTNPIGTNFGAGSGNAANDLSAEYVYNLSVRTALYAQAAQISNTGTAAFKVNGAAGTPTNGKSTGVGLGIRHSF